MEPVTYPTSEHNANLEFPPPADLTPHIIRLKNQHSAGGSFGDVYRCQYRDGSVLKEAAVKAFRFCFSIDGESGDIPTKMLRRELGIWRRLEHKNIVPFLGVAYGFGMDGTMSLVSLWMPNQSVHTFLTKHDKDMGLGQRLQILLDIANGLHYLHSFPIVHGDLNSNNVLLDSDYSARLGDFGYSSLVGNIPEGMAYLQRSTARPGALRWIAPEQIDPEETYHRTTKSDIYSFGCVALQVLSGKQPWSEIREDAAVVLRLARAQTPGRPNFRLIDDAHWNFIQTCWLPSEERPAAALITPTIQRFLNNCPSFPPLHEMFMPPCTRADARVDESIVTLDSSCSKPDTPAEARYRQSSTSQAHPPPPTEPLTHAAAARPMSPRMEGAAQAPFRCVIDVDRMDWFAEGPHYGPVLEPLLAKIVRANIKLNPLILPPVNSPDDHLRWNMLFDTTHCYRTSKSSRHWINGRHAPATHPRVSQIQIISRAFPWMIHASAQNPKSGVSCGDVLDAISAFMYENAAKKAFENELTARKRQIWESYRFNRSTDPNAPGQRLGEGLKRLDWLGSSSMFGGLVQNDAFVKEHYGDLVSCTFELNCLSSYPLTAQEL